MNEKTKIQNSSHELKHINICSDQLIKFIDKMMVFFILFLVKLFILFVLIDFRF